MVLPVQDFPLNSAFPVSRSTPLFQLLNKHFDRKFHWMGIIEYFCPNSLSRNRLGTFRHDQQHAESCPHIIFVPNFVFFYQNRFILQIVTLTKIKLKKKLVWNHLNYSPWPKWSCTKPLIDAVIKILKKWPTLYQILIDETVYYSAYVTSRQCYKGVYISSMGKGDALSQDTSVLIYHLVVLQKELWPNW